MVNSRKFLILSGLRPREELRKYVIKVVSDFSVKRNFQEHGLVIATYVFHVCENISRKEENIFYCKKTYRRPLSAINTTSVSVFLQTNPNLPARKWHVLFLMILQTNS